MKEPELNQVLLMGTEHVKKQHSTIVGDTATMLKVDVDKNPYTANRFQITGVPTLILFHNGHKIGRQSGIVLAQNLAQLSKIHLSIAFDFTT